MQNTQEKYKAYRDEKERTIILLRDEIKNLKSNNEALSKISHI